MHFNHKRGNVEYINKNAFLPFFKLCRVHNLKIDKTMQNDEIQIGIQSENCFILLKLTINWKFLFALRFANVMLLK